ncbi:MAG: hypothetical protein WBC92_01020 [Terracidiphilus sp.]
MAIFFVYFSNGFSERQMALVAAVNLAAGVGLLIFISRRWIAKMK